MQDADFLHSGLSLYYLGSIHTWCQGTVPEYGNYLALKIFKYSCWNLGAMPVKDLVLKHKSGHWVPLWRSILLLLGQSTALHSLLKAHVPQWGLTGQNGVTMYTESHSAYSKCGPNTFLFSGTHWCSLVPGHEMWTAPYSPKF